MRPTLSYLRSQLRPIYGDRETEAIIRIMFHHLKGWNLTDMLIHEPEPLSPFIKGEVEKILQRLLRHEPIQYITGEARFHGLELHVTPDVLIPRPETAELVDIIADDAHDTPDLRVLDIATGSGCIAIALARTLKFPQVTALDISQAAIDIAKENARTLKTRINFICADIFTWPTKNRTANPSLPKADTAPTPLAKPSTGKAQEADAIPNFQAKPSTGKAQEADAIPNSIGKFDIIVSNPPYIDESEKETMERNVLDYEPHTALFVPDDDPLLFYRRIADLALRLLPRSVSSAYPGRIGRGFRKEEEEQRPGGLYLEINPRHAAQLATMLKRKGFSTVDILKDSYGKDRFIRALT